MLQSSAYRTKFSPIAYKLLVKLLSMILTSSGLRFQSCGVPTVVSSYLPPIITPLTKNFLIRDITLPSFIVRDMLFIFIRSRFR